jgi:hypothetical protein
LQNPTCGPPLPFWIDDIDEDIVGPSKAILEGSISDETILIFVNNSLNHQLQPVS